MKVGDVVRLNSCNVNMTVYHISDDKFYISCIWFNEITGEYSYRAFHVDLIMLVK